MVDNRVDIRGCEKDNPTEPRSGAIHLHGNTADSVVESNDLYETDGVRLSASYSVEHDDFVSRGKFQYFNEVRTELKRVAWPSRREVFTFTVVTLITSGFVTLYTFGLDVAFTQAILTFLELR